MALVAALVAALACLGVGLVLASAPWLIGSLAASGLAAALLWAGRTRATAATEAAAPSPAHAQVWIVAGRGRYHRADCEIIADDEAQPVSRAKAASDGLLPCSLCAP